jgi:hypothetical protein
VRSVLDARRDADDAWAVDLKEGLTYRINLLPRSPGHCIAADLYRPDTRAFVPANALLRLRCGGYGLFTPAADGTGRYTLHLRAEPGVNGAQPYRLLVGRAESDDVTPGRAIANGDVVRGVLYGEGLDVVDLYGFTAQTRSVFDAVVTTRPWVEFEAFVLGPGGERVPLVRSRIPGRLALHQHLDRGVYFLALRSHERSRGRYTLDLSVKTLTTTELSIGGAYEVETTFGAWQRLVAAVQPPVSGGTVRFQLERFDPLGGWQFAGYVFGTVGGDGVAVAGWLPPSMGQWRVTARFLGTDDTSPSRSESVRAFVGVPG